VGRARARPPGGQRTQLYIVYCILVKAWADRRALLHGRVPALVMNAGGVELLLPVIVKFFHIIKESFSCIFLWFLVIVYHAFIMDSAHYNNK